MDFVWAKFCIVRITCICVRERACVCVLHIWMWACNSRVSLQACYREHRSEWVWRVWVRQPTADEHGGLCVATPPLPPHRLARMLDTSLPRPHLHALQRRCRTHTIPVMSPAYTPLTSTVKNTIWGEKRHQPRLRGSVWWGSMRRKCRVKQREVVTRLSSDAPRFYCKHCLLLRNTFCGREYLIFLPRLSLRLHSISISPVFVICWL